MGETLTTYRVFMNNLNIRGCYDDVGTDGRLALKCILRKLDGSGLNSSGKPRNSCEHSKETSGSTKRV
jgi:hypothetical protein